MFEIYEIDDNNNPVAFIGKDKIRSGAIEKMMLFSEKHPDIEIDLMQNGKWTTWIFPSKIEMR